MTKRNIDVSVPVIIPVTFLHTKQSDLFDGISFFIDASLYIIVDGLRKYPQALGKVIVVNGGEVHPQFNFEETTYILSKGLPLFRIPKFSESQLISPDWISDCVKKQQLLETKEFLVVRQTPTDDNDNDKSSSEEIEHSEEEGISERNGNDAFSSSNGKVKFF